MGGRMVRRRRGDRRGRWGGRGRRMRAFDELALAVLAGGGVGSERQGEGGDEREGDSGLHGNHLHSRHLHGRTGDGETAPVRMIAGWRAH